MSLSTSTTNRIRAWRSGLESEQRFRTAVRGVLHHLLQPQTVVERRRDERFSYPRLILLTPVDEGLVPLGRTVTAAARQLSESGVSFFHPEPMPHRLMMIELNAHEPQSVRLLLDIMWCRFTLQGWYESGGRFLSLLDGPRAA